MLDEFMSTQSPDEIRLTIEKVTSESLERLAESLKDTPP